MLAEQSMARFETVMAAKVRGAWTLHELTRGLPLEFFVLFSSGAALLGSPGQGNYAAANGFLDALAHFREVAGLPALSINWGSWSDVGMAADLDEQHHRRWSAMGLEMITPEAGVGLLRDALFSGARAQIAAVPLNRSKLPAGAPPFLSELVVRRSEPEAQSADVIGRIRECPPEQRHQLVTDYLSDELVKVLALGANAKIDARRSIVELGLDSLMAMELRNRLQGSLDVRVAVADLLEGPSVERLAGIVLEGLQPAAVDDPEHEETLI